MAYIKVAGVLVARVRGTPVLGRRSRLGGSLVVVPGTWLPKSSGRVVSRSIALRLARTPVDHRTSALLTSATPRDLHTDSTDRPPVKNKTTLSPCTLPLPDFATTHQQTLLCKAEA